MQAQVFFVGATHLMACTDQERIFVHASCAEFALANCAHGDVIEVHAVENTDRGPRALSASWVSRPEAFPRYEFTGQVMNIHHGFLFARPDGESDEVFCHITAFADYSKTSKTFESLRRGDRVRGYFQQDDRGRRGSQIERV